MRKIYFLLLSAELFIGAFAFAAAPEIKLSGRKDRVLSSKMRMIVLDVAKECLYKENEGFIALAQGLEDPYGFKDEAAPSGPTTVAIATQEPEAVAASVVYGDASILKAVAANFSKQVRGTLARGSMHYLQLQGGGMLKSGTSFPVKIPQLAGQSFTVTISDVHSRGYTLTLGDAILTVPFGQSSGATRNYTK